MKNEPIDPCWGLLEGKHILLMISSSVAAYKTLDWIRHWQTLGAQVKAMCTPGATRMISPDVLRALSGHDVWLTETHGEMTHIIAKQWADVTVVAPASANLLGQWAQGLGPHLAATTLLCLDPKRTVFCPAMNPSMWHHPALKANVAQLQAMGATLVKPHYGLVACGEEGYGKLATLTDVQWALARHLTAHELGQPLHGKRITITAGPTREYFDPIRFLSNRSTGKMALACAMAAHALGADVDYLHHRSLDLSAHQVLDTRVFDTASDLHEIALQPQHSDAWIATAAVCNYRPEELHRQKIKSQTRWTPTLILNPDILTTLAKHHPQLCLVGFAAETHHLKAHALKKLKDKGLDALVANPVSDQQGFEANDNEATLIWADGRQVRFPRAHKLSLARALLAALAADLPWKTAC